MARGRFDWIGDVWRAVVGDRVVLALLVAAVAACVVVLALALR